MAKKGHIPWNKGLTKRTNECLKKISEKISKGRIKKFTENGQRVLINCDYCRIGFWTTKSVFDKSRKHHCLKCRKRPIPEQVLRNLYWDNKLSISQCAKRLNVSCSVIRCRMNEYGIEARPKSNKGGHLSIEAIDKMSRALRGKPKSRVWKDNRRKINAQRREGLGITKQNLLRWIIEEKTSPPEIAKNLKVGTSIIQSWAKKWGIIPQYYPELNAIRSAHKRKGNVNRSKETKKRVSRLVSEQNKKRWTDPHYKAKVSLKISDMRIKYYDRIGRTSKTQRKVNNSMSRMIYRAIRERKNGHRWEELVGYTTLELMTHLEKQFKLGMSWDNMGRGGWQIDHKIPRNVFNYTSPNHIDFKRCWALNNLQPLWERENIIKKDKIKEPFQPSLALG